MYVTRNDIHELASHYELARGEVRIKGPRSEILRRRALRRETEDQEAEKRIDPAQFQALPLEGRERLKRTFKIILQFFNQKGVSNAFRSTLLRRLTEEGLD